MEPKLFICSFNWHGELHTFKPKANNEDHAFNKCCATIAKKLGHRSSFEVRHYFYGTDKYNIREVIEDDKGITQADVKCSK